MKKPRRNIRPGLIIPVLIVCLGQAAWGEEVRRLSPDEAVALAIKNNLSLEASRVGTATKERKYKTAWNVFVPAVELGGTLGRLNVAPAITGVAPSVPLGTILPGLPGEANNLYLVTPYSLSGPQWVLAGSLSASLNLNFGLFEAMRNLRLDYEAGLISYDKARQGLERDVRKSYYQILLLKENLDLLAANLDAAEKRAVMAEANYNAGLVPRLTMLQARVALENLKPSIKELENGIMSSMAAFTMNLGLPFGTGVELVPVENPENLITLDADDLIQKAASSKPDILELTKNIEALKSRKKATTFQVYTPTLALGWNFDPAFQNDPFKTSWFSDISNNWKQQSGMFRVTLAYRISSLLPFSSEAQSLKDIDDTIKTMNINLAQLVRGTEVEIFNSVLTLEKSKDSIDTLKVNVDLAEQSYGLTEEAFQAGLVELLEVQNSELELHKARLEVLKETYNYVMGLLDLEYAIGVPFGTLTSEGNVTRR